MDAAEHIDDLVARHPDWRGQTLAECRRLILEAAPGITEGWKYMGAPAWDLDGPLIVGGIFKTKVKIGFQYGASLPDPEGLFNGELNGNQRRSVEFAEGDEVAGEALQELVRAAIQRNHEASAARAAKER